MSEQGRTKGVTARAVVLGILMVGAINLYDPFSAYVIHATAFTRSHFPFAVLLVLLVLVLGVNPLLRRFAPRVVFSRGELMTLVAIGFLGCSIPTAVGRLLATVSAPDYFASAENQWPDYVLANLPANLIPSDAQSGVTQFYQGLPPGAAAVWQVWVTPLFWWLSFVVAVVVGCFCISVILRRQWAERERLTFPLVQVPLLLASEPEKGRLFPRIFRDRLFWFAFAVPLACVLWNIVGYFWPAWPTMEFLSRHYAKKIGPDFPDLIFKFDLYVICFAFFTNLEILLSLWFFHYFTVLEIGFTNRLGLSGGGGEAGAPWQGYFGLMFFVFWGLYISRDHLRDVWRKAWNPRCPVDDSCELISYRSAVVGLAIAGCYVVVWMWRAGMSPHVSVLVTLFSLVIYLGLAKIVALGGLVALRSPLNSHAVTTTVVGAHNMTNTTSVATNLMFAMYAGDKGFCMPAAFNAVRAADETAPPGNPAEGKRPLGRAILIGVVLSLVVCVAVTIWLGYHMGAQNFGSYDFDFGNHHPYQYATAEIKAKLEPHKFPIWPTVYGTFGVLMVSALTFLNYRVPWWPLHPVGFTVAFAYPVRFSSFSLFVAWLVKWVILKVGGISLYRRAQVAVLGVLAGYTTGAVLSFLVDLIFFFGQGHPVHTPPI